MGVYSSSDKQFLKGWTKVQKQQTDGLFTNVWVRNRNNNKIEMVEYPLHVSSQDQIKEERKIFEFRHNHPQLVASLYFIDESENQFCSSNHQGVIFVERIPISLQTVTDVPFPDALHVYSQSLQGFHILANQIVKDFFPVSEQLIGVNCQSVIKVWMNTRFQYNFPNRKENIPEYSMVRMVLEAIQENVDHSSLGVKPSPMSYIYSSSRSPSEVRFDEAINLFRNYTKTYFSGIVKQKLDCVQKVGGVFNLARNWKNKYDEGRKLTRYEEKSQNFPSFPVPRDESILNKTFIMQSQIRQNNQVPIQPQSSSREVPLVQPIMISQSGDPEKISTPSFRSIFFSQFNEIANNSHYVSTVPQINTVANRNGFSVSPTLSQSNVRIIPQIVHNQFVKSPPAEVIRGSRSKNIYPNPEQRRNQIIFNPQSVLPQKVVSARQSLTSPYSKNINNSAPFKYSNNVVNSFQQSMIENRVINPLLNQIPIFPQQKAAFVPIIQQAQPINQAAYLQNLQQINFSNQQMIPINKVDEQGVAVQENSIRFSKTNQFQSFPLKVLSNYQTTTTTSVFVNPQSQNNQVKAQNVVSQVLVIENESNQVKAQAEKQTLPSGEPSMRLRNNEQSISSITTQTNKPTSNDQFSDKFSTMKEEIIDYSTRNFYTDMVNNQNLSNLQNDQFTSYYANYTSKLYDNPNETFEYENASTKYYLISKQEDINTKSQDFKYKTNFDSKYDAKYDTKFDTKYDTKFDSKFDKKFETKFDTKFDTQFETKFDSKVERSDKKYCVDLNDGMSSTAFLNELKSLKLIENTFKKGQTNFDYGIATSELKSLNKHSDNLLNKYSGSSIGTQQFKIIQNQQSDPFVQIKSPTSDNKNQKIKLDDQTQYRVSYQYEEHERPALSTRNQSKFSKSYINNTYEEQYEITNYQSIFDKYAGNYKNQSSAKQLQSAIKFGQNLQTQYSRSQAEDAHCFEVTKNTTNSSSYNNFSPQKPLTEEQYKVDYDPEILADLQKLKGIN